MPKSTRLPAFAYELREQEPRAGPFSVHDLAWTDVTQMKLVFKSAAISKWRLQDFLDGEGVRGQTKVKCSKHCGSDGLLTDLVAECDYGHLKGTARQAAWNSSVSNALGHKRRRKLAMHDSKKVECGYRFTIKEFCKLPGTVFIKFAHSDGEGLCQTMRHVLADGTEAHKGRTDHISHTEEMYQFVVEKLKAGCQVKVVLEGLRQLYMDACTVSCFGLCLQPV
jgi:hypothetical protein